MTECSDSQISRNKTLFYKLDSSLSRHVNAASRKSLEIQAQPRTHSERKFV